MGAFSGAAASVLLACVWSSLLLSQANPEPAAQCKPDLSMADSTETMAHGLIAPGGWYLAGNKRRLPPRHREELERLLRDLKPHITIPALQPPDAQFPLSSLLPDKDARFAVMFLWSRVTFVIRADGTVGKATTDRTFGKTELDSALVLAVEQAGIAGVFRGALSSLHVDTSSWSAGDSLRLDLYVSDHTAQQDVSLPLSMVRVPRYRVRIQPAVAKRGNPPPRYPEIASQAKVKGDVLVQFVVDTSGAPDISTVKVLRANYQDFVLEVVKVLPQYRFEPATVDGCRVKMWVQLPFEFNLRD